MSMGLPQEFVRQMQALGLADVSEVLEGTEASVSVRLNSRKGVKPPGSAEPVAWCERGFYMPERPVFALDPAWHQGRYYVQEAGSMFLGHVVKKIAEGRALTVLDACASPGGKTTTLMDSLPAGSMVVANEAIPARANILVENVTKWGSPYSIVTRADTRELARAAGNGSFDLVVVDAPCSGEGMMRREAMAVSQWSSALIERCAGLQREIITNLWPLLRPGGCMVYSTCTFNRTENEQMIEWILREFDAEGVEIPIDASWGITRAIDSDIPAYRFLPGRTRSEGLFMAVVSKPGNLKDTPTDTWIVTVADRERATAFPVGYEKLRKRLSRLTLCSGTELYTIKGRDRIPSHALAMSRELSAVQGEYPQFEVDRDSALAYLRCENIPPVELPGKGYVLLTHEGSPLGFVKHLGNRMNNLYPRHWQLRMRQ